MRGFIDRSPSCACATRRGALETLWTAATTAAEPVATGADRHRGGVQLYQRQCWINGDNPHYPARKSGTNGMNTLPWLRAFQLERPQPCCEFTWLLVCAQGTKTLPSRPAAC